MSLSKKDYVDLADRVRVLLNRLDNAADDNGQLRLELVKGEIRETIEGFNRAQNSRYASGRFWGYVAETNGPSGGAR